MGKHARRSKTVQYTSVAAAGAVLAGTAIGAAPAVAQAGPVLPEHPAKQPVTNAAAFTVKQKPPKTSAALAEYTVRPGDSLWAIAAAKCGAGGKWSRLWNANYKTVGANPNLIRPGQLLKLACNAAARVFQQAPAVVPTAGSGPSSSDSDDAPSPGVTVTGGQGIIGTDALRALQNLVIERVDEGQDLGGTGPLYPVAPGTIESTAPNGWPGSAYILEKLDQPIDGYDYVYYAEDITPEVSPGEHVTDGTVLGNAYDGGSGMELGWGTAVPGEAAAYGHYSEGQPTPEGESFSAFLLGQHDHPSAPAPAPAAPTSGPVTSGFHIPGMPDSLASCIAYRESTDGTNPAALDGGTPNYFGIIPASGYDVAGLSLAQQEHVAAEIYAAVGGVAWSADGCPGT